MRRYVNAAHCFRKEAGLKEEFHIRAKEGKRERDGDEFAGHRALVVAPDYCIQANLGKRGRVGGGGGGAGRGVIGS